MGSQHHVRTVRAACTVRLCVQRRICFVTEAGTPTTAIAVAMFGKKALQEQMQRLEENLAPLRQN